jgi:uncharacterized protein (DUF927 family)
MKIIFLLSLLLSGMCFAQSKEITTQISQEIRPDYATASHLIVTKMFAKEASGKEWIEIYEHETNVKKFRDASQAKKEEYARAEEIGKQLLAEGKIPEKMEPMLGNETIER